MTLNTSIVRSNTDNKLFLLVFIITLIVFVFTSDGHRYTFDEDITQKQSMRIATMKPDPSYVQGESRLLFEYPTYFPNNPRPVCLNAILCSTASIGSSLTQVPFILINQIFHIIIYDIIWTSEDFNDPHYVWWRNSIEPDFTFLDLFYGPLFSALSIGIFFLICRSFDFSRKNSILLSLLYGLATTAWAYSQTSLNAVPMTFFVLLGFLFFKKFQKSQSNIDLIFCGSSLGFAFLIRNDTVFFIGILFLLLIYDLWKQKEKMKKFSSYLIPTVSSYIIYQMINFVRIGSSSINVGETPTYYPTPFYVGAFGLLLSPGVGLLIFAPILFTMFLSFPDFYIKNKKYCIVFLAVITSFLIFYGTLEFWHGLNAWGARYLLPIVPFMLLPLGESIVKRKNKIFKISLIILAALGLFFNLVYLVQDVSWFVWGSMSSDNETGLYALGKYTKGLLWTHPLVIWTFEYSQLTHSIMWAFERLQPDIFLLKVLGAQGFTLLFVALLALPVYVTLRLRDKQITSKQ